MAGVSVVCVCVRESLCVLQTNKRGPNESRGCCRDLSQPPSLGSALSFVVVPVRNKSPSLRLAVALQTAGSFRSRRHDVKPPGDSVAGFTIKKLKITENTERKSRNFSTGIWPGVERRLISSTGLLPGRVERTERASKQLPKLLWRSDDKH